MRNLTLEHRKGDFNDPIAGILNIQDAFHNRVDLLTGIRGMTREVFTRVKETQFMGSSIKMAGLEDFIAMKIFAGGQKDIQDVRGVLQVSGKQADLDLLKKITAGYGKDCVVTLLKLLEEYL